VRLAAFSGASQYAGAERALGDLLAHLDPAIEVTVLGPDAAVREELIRRRPGARALAAGGIADKRDAAAMRRYVGALRAVRPDILQLNLTTPWSCRHETLLALAMPGLRVVAVEHLPMPFDSRWMRRLKPLLAAGYAAHVAVGEQAARDIERHAGLRAGSVRAIPGGVEPFALERRDRDRARPRIGTIARLHAVKNVDDLLRALTRLPGVELEIVGDGPERGRLSELAQALGVADRTLFAGWSQDTRAWLGRWDALVLPSSAEGLPLAILDAMLAELPVIATPVGSVPEAIRHERTGLLVPVGDPDGLAAAIRRLLGDGALAERLATAARAHALAHFTVPTMARAYEALYAEILSGRRA
jgi:glycosyltransferase involved in cell wall biosynthesis